LRTVAHRPWPLPARPWLLSMIWEDLLFAHWPVAAGVLRRQVPRALDLDLFDGQAWLGIVPFRMRGVRPRGLPPLPGLSAFPELNVRTYVRGPDGRAGVWFFSLDAGQPLAVAGARLAFGLPYWRARMRCRRAGEWIDYESRRTHRGAAPAVLRGRYRPTGAVLQDPGALAAWLTERYCMFMARPLGGPPPHRLYRGDIQHPPWPLQPAAAEFSELGMAEQLGLRLTGPPLLHFAHRQDVVAWRPQRLGSATAAV
jgi:uncharacterized protein YqjF (DUF2071 family)